MWIDKKLEELKAEVARRDAMSKQERIAEDYGFDRGLIIKCPDGYHMFAAACIARCEHMCEAVEGLIRKKGEKIIG